MLLTLKNLYIMKLFTKEKLAETVKYNWITADQYKDITEKNINDLKPNAWGFIIK